jgi:hypothetical protein
MASAAAGPSVAVMNPRLLALLPIAAITLAAAPAAEAGKKPRKRLSATYMVTIKATLDAKWQYHDHWATSCDGSSCTRTTDGSGTEHVHVETKQPFPVFVTRGYGGRPPGISLGSDGIPMRGSSLVQGTLTTDYAGPWEAANPDVVRPTTDCGQRAIDDFGSIGWSGDTPDHLMLLVDTDPLREHCPDAPPYPVEWENDEQPALQDVLGRVGKGKFLGTKQFTVRGTKTFKGLVPTVSEEHRTQNGDAQATWSWRATFRMQGRKRR